MHTLITWGLGSQLNTLIGWFSFFYSHQLICFTTLFFLYIYFLFWQFCFLFTDTHSGRGRWGVEGAERVAYVCVCMSVYVLFVNTESLVSFLFRNAACVTRFLLRLSARTFSNWMLPQRNGMQQPCEMRGGNPRKVRRMSTRSLPLTGSHFHSLCKLRFAHLQK